MSAASIKSISCRDGSVIIFGYIELDIYSIPHFTSSFHTSASVFCLDKVPV